MRRTTPIRTRSCRRGRSEIDVLYGVTTSENVWTTDPAAFLAVILRVYVLAVPAAGVPERVAVPLPLSTKFTPLGSVPVEVSAGVG